MRFIRSFLKFIDIYVPNGYALLTRGKNSESGYWIKTVILVY